MGANFITGAGGFCPNVTLVGKISLAWSSKGSSSYGTLCHQTAPFPSIVPLPLIVSPTSFVNSSHWRRPEPQWLEPVGATIVPSNCDISTNTRCSINEFIFNFPYVSIRENCYLKDNVVLTVWTGKRDGPHREHVIFWDINDWSFNLTSSSPGNLKCLDITTTKKIGVFSFLLFFKIEINTI